MGDTAHFQELTKHDRVTVVLYRVGIVLATLCLSGLAFGANLPVAGPDGRLRLAGVVLTGLFASVGVSVFFIHLYMSSFHRGLKRMYVVAVACFAALLALGGGNPAATVGATWYGPLLLIPLSLCLGFVTAKEAFCFRLFEGYLIAMALPVFLAATAAGLMRGPQVQNGLMVLAVLLMLFTARKVFQPIHYDIGDKTAYQ